MKTKHLLWLLIATMLIFASCKGVNNPENKGNYKDTIILGTGHQPVMIDGDNDGNLSAAAPPSVITLVKFYNSGQENKVIVQHGIENSRLEAGTKYDNGKLYLNFAINDADGASQDGLNKKFVKWAEEKMHLAGSTPFIPLVEGYYLVDWRWNQLLPLCAFSTSWPGASPDRFGDHITNHIFMTDIDWKDLKDLTAGYDTANYNQPVKGIEFIRMLPLTLSQYFNDVDSNPYDCWYSNIYYSYGMCLQTACLYDEYGDCTDSGKTYLSYITYCDSIQSVYQRHLIELINSDKIKELGF